MNRAGFLRGLIVICIMAAISQDAVAAAKERLSVVFTPFSSRARQSAPIPGLWTIHFNGAEVLEGHINVTMKINHVEQHLRIPDVVITPGVETQFRGLLPTLDIPEYGNQDIVQAELYLDFVTNDGREFPSEVQPLFFPSPIRQSFVIAICDPGMEGGAPVGKELADGLSFEKFHGKKGASSLKTWLAHMPPTVFPVDPISYCAFDLVMLSENSLMALDGKQLESIAKWVRAGGSLCVIPTTALGANHLKFLNDFAEYAKSEIIFVSDSKGRLSASGAAEGQEYALFHVGLGRVAVGLTPDRSSHDPQSPAWREMSSFLWRINGNHRRSIQETGLLDEDNLSKVYRDQWGQYGVAYSDSSAPIVPLSQLLASQPSSIWTENLIGQLMPEDFQFVPLWMVSGLLLLFIVVIGPVDYFLLGALKMRKYTWVFFPITAFLFAFATVWIANTYMGSTNQTRAYQILDIGDDGEVLRANRLELHYNAAAIHSETELSGAMFTSLNTATSSFAADRSNTGEPPLLSGRMPQQLTVIEDIPQWTPRLNRKFWIAPGDKVEVPTKFDWNSIDVFKFESEDDRQAIAAPIRAAFGSDCSIWLINQNIRHPLSRNSRLMMNSLHGRRGYPSDVIPSAPVQPTVMSQRIKNFRNDVFSDGQEMINSLSARAGSGIFSVSSQVSPKGGWSLDDLAVMDVTDPDQALLVVAQQQENDVVIYRKLYRRRQHPPADNENNNASSN